MIWGHVQSAVLLTIDDFLAHQGEGNFPHMHMHMQDVVFVDGNDMRKIIYLRIMHGDIGLWSNP